MLRMNENTGQQDEMSHSTKNSPRKVVDSTSLVGSHVARATVYGLGFAIVLTALSCALVGYETGPTAEPTERSFDSLADYAEWCGQLRVDAVNYRTHGEMTDAIEHGLKAYLLATPVPELVEFHELRAQLTEMTLEMFSRHPRDGAPYDTIHMADEGAANFAYFANRLGEVQRGLEPGTVETLKDGDCIR